MKMWPVIMSFNITIKSPLTAFAKRKTFMTMHLLTSQRRPLSLSCSTMCRARASHILPVTSFTTQRTFLTRSRKQMPLVQPVNVSCSQQNHFSQSVPLCDAKKFVVNEMSETQYEALAEETLNSLQDFFDVLPDVSDCTDEYDSEFGNGVLTVHFNSVVGTYVINKQTPNKQIWLSSPKTGPKRYDFCGDKWIYRHDGVGLHHLLEEEISEILGIKVSLKDCKHYS